MRRHAWIAAVLVALAAGENLSAGAPPACGEPGRMNREGEAPAEPGDRGSAGASPSRAEPGSSCWQRLAPVGGWCPYPGGLLHWWNPDCFPHGGAPDLYHRKQLPCCKWHPYPPYYIWAPLGH